MNPEHVEGVFYPGQPEGRHGGAGFCRGDLDHDRDNDDDDDDGDVDVDGKGKRRRKVSI